MSGNKLFGPVIRALHFKTWSPDLNPTTGFNIFDDKFVIKANRIILDKSTTFGCVSAYLYKTTSQTPCWWSRYFNVFLQNKKKQLCIIDNTFFLHSALSHLGITDQLYTSTLLDQIIKCIHLLFTLGWGFQLSASYKKSSHESPKVASLTVVDGQILAC